MKAFRILAPSVLLPALAWAAPVHAQNPPEPTTLASLFADPEPLTPYIQAFHAIRFIVRARAAAASTESEAPPEARTVLLYDERGNFQFTRAPFQGEPRIELVHLQGRFYVKRGPERSFRRVSRQPEFHRWIHGALKEILAFYERHGFAALPETAREGSLPCRSRGEDRLCLDAETGLPLSGNYRDAAELEFSISPATPDSIRISLDTPAAQPLKTGTSGK